jgi:hypothetical protein
MVNVPTLHLRNGKDCIVVCRDSSCVVYVGRVQGCQGPHRVEGKEEVDASTRAQEPSKD